MVKDHYATIAMAAVALLLIGFSQTAGDARLFAGRHRYRIDMNQESVAQGMANAGAGLFQGMPVSTSLSASSLNDVRRREYAAGVADDWWPVLRRWCCSRRCFRIFPRRCRGRHHRRRRVRDDRRSEMRRIYRISRFDFWIAVAAIVGVLSVGVLAGVVMGRPFARLARLRRHEAGSLQVV